eukprot:m.4263 g.4263  ORF g.4263 m.4263 type:complete len:307 (+) comp2402_c0_seq1:59-979(+)
MLHIIMVDHFDVLRRFFVEVLAKAGQRLRPVSRWGNWHLVLLKATGLEVAPREAIVDHFPREHTVFHKIANEFRCVLVWNDVVVAEMIEATKARLWKPMLIHEALWKVGLEGVACAFNTQYVGQKVVKSYVVASVEKLSKGGAHIDKFVDIGTDEAIHGMSHHNDTTIRRVGPQLVGTRKGQVGQPREVKKIGVNHPSARIPLGISLHAKDECAPLGACILRDAAHDDFVLVVNHRPKAWKPHEEVRLKDGTIANTGFAVGKAWLWDCGPCNSRSSEKCSRSEARSEAGSDNGNKKRRHAQCGCAL